MCHMHCTCQHSRLGYFEDLVNSTAVVDYGLTVYTPIFFALHGKIYVNKLVSGFTNAISVISLEGTVVACASTLGSPSCGTTTCTARRTRSRTWYGRVRIRRTAYAGINTSSRFIRLISTSSAWNTCTTISRTPVARRTRLTVVTCYVNRVPSGSGTVVYPARLSRRTGEAVGIGSIFSRFTGFTCGVLRA